MKYNRIFSYILYILYYYVTPITIHNFPYTKKLNSENYIIISSGLITFSGPTLSYDFNLIEIDDIYNNIDESYSTTVSQFSYEDNGYIIILIKNSIYVLSSEEYLLSSKKNINLIETNNYIYSIVPYGHSNHEYYFAIIYPDNKDNNLYIIKCKFDSSTNQTSYESPTAYNYIDLIGVKNSISCQLMSYYDKNVINCLYGSYDKYVNINLDPSNNFNIVEELPIQSNTFTKGTFFKSTILPGNSQAILCNINEDLEFLCFKYNILDNKFIKNNTLTFNNCDKISSKMYVEYFSEINKIILGCSTNQEFYLSRCNIDFECEEIETIQVLELSSGPITKSSIVYPYNQDKYNIIASLSDETSSIMKLDLEEELICYYLFNYNRTGCLEILPYGYFVNDTSKKTIDKCDEKCKVCNSKPTPDGEHCLSCFEPYYLDFDNCTTNCPYSNFVDDYYNTYRCTCSSDKSCKICTYESVQTNTCISCNNYEGYYAKVNDMINNYNYHCYNDETIDEGYYLNTEYSHYESCYKKCKKCSAAGNDTNNNCDECNEGYTLIDHIENDKNCYNICDFYYYFDSSNMYNCTDKYECPNGYKLVKEKNKCIDNCTNDNKYIYEYENECYSICPSDMKPSREHICLGKKVCPEEYPYELVEFNECVENCNTLDLINKVCKINNPVANQDGIKNIRDSIKNGTLDELLDEILNTGKDLTLSEEGIKYQITTTKNQKINKNVEISTINLGDCETRLKTSNGINGSLPLLIFKIDITVEGLKFPIVEYEVYDPNTKNILNLSVCSDLLIGLEVPVNIKEDELSKYDPTSEFYNDICTTTTSENGTDIILSDRKNEYANKNFSLCDADCTFNGYDSSTKKASCNCNVKTEINDISEIKIDKSKFLKGFVDLKSIINIDVMKCYELLFSKKGFTNNISNYIILPIIILFFTSIIIFPIKGYPGIKKQIQGIIDIMKKYENNENNLDLFDRNINVYISENIGINNPPNKKSKKKNLKLLSKYVHNYNANRINIEKIKHKQNNEKVGIKHHNISKKKRIIDNNENNFIDNTSYTKRSNANIIEEKKKKIIKNMKYYNDYELNTLSYQDAIEIDKRTYWQYYWALIKKKQLVIFSFYPTNDYNSMIIKICLFLFSFVLYFTVNALFFTDSTMHKIYEDNGVFDIFYHLPQMLYSTLISAVINLIVKTLSLSEKNILTIKNEKNIEDSKKKIPKILKCLIIKFILFYVISILLLILFWYYLACFCAVYKNTQKHLLSDTLMSFFFSLLYPFGLNLLPGILRIPALQKKNWVFVYKISQIIQLI